MSQFLQDNNLQILQSFPESTEVLPTSDILLILSNLNRRHTTQKISSINLGFHSAFYSVSQVHMARWLGTLSMSALVSIYDLQKGNILNRR